MQGSFRRENLQLLLYTSTRPETFTAMQQAGKKEKGLTNRTKYSQSCQVDTVRRRHAALDKSVALQKLIICAYAHFIMTAT